MEIYIHALYYLEGILKSNFYQKFNYLIQYKNFSEKILLIGRFILYLYIKFVFIYIT
jgi:hypothetical protein